MPKKFFDNDEITSIFSELSNPTRVKILYLLKEKSKSTSQLARDLKTSIQNIQRHLSRLLTSNLITKNVDGEIYLTQLGKFLISWIPSITFVSNNREYFQNHSFDGIPDEFLVRIGDLHDSQFFPPGMELFETAMEMNENVREFAYGMATNMPTDQYRVSKTPLKSGAKYKIVFGKNTKVTKDFYDPKKREQWQKAIETGQIQERFIEFLPLTLHVNESMAMFDFAYRKSKQSEFQGIFFSKDSKFRNWCMALSYYYWTKVEKIKPFKIKPTE